MTEYIRPFHFPHTTEKIGTNKTLTTVTKNGNLNKHCYVSKVENFQGLEEMCIEEMDNLANHYKENDTTFIDIFAYQFECSFTYESKEGIEQDYTIRGSYHDDTLSAFESFMTSFYDVERKFEISDYDLNDFIKADIYFNVIY